MSQPFDLDAAVSKAAGDPFPFTWGGQRFELPPILAMDIEVQLELIGMIERLDKEQPSPVDLMAIIKKVLGEEALTQMRAVRPIAAVALMALVEQWMAAQGGALGKSSPSPGSSANGAPPSKPTLRSGRGRKTS